MIFDHALTAEEIAALYNDIASLRGDLDGDGVVASRDLDIVRSWWYADVTPGQLDHGDANGDGRVDSQDLNIVRGNWGRSVAGSAVPEPSSLLLLSTTLGGLMVWTDVGSGEPDRFRWVSCYSGVLGMSDTTIDRPTLT